MQPPTPPVPPTFIERQIATYRYDVHRWAQRLGLSEWALWVILAGVVVAGCGLWGIAGLNAMTDSARARAFNTATTQAAAAEVTETAIPTATQAAQSSVQAQPTATSAPIPTATPSAVVLHVSGNGSKTTASFAVHGTWQVDWACNGGALLIQFHDAHTNDYALNLDDIQYDCPDNGGRDTSVMHGSGTYYLSVMGGDGWDITVTDLPN
ncbi:MAG TPA: hypothetical protein VF040_02810 [Ktedonobacterales bacterium]